METVLQDNIESRDKNEKITNIICYIVSYFL